MGAIASVLQWHCIKCGLINPTEQVKCIRCGHLRRLSAVNKEQIDSAYNGGESSFGVTTNCTVIRRIRSNEPPSVTCPFNR